MPVNEMIYDPAGEFSDKYAKLHYENTCRFFDRLAEKADINAEENRETVRQYREHRENLEYIRKRFNKFRVLRVLMIISIVLLPLVFLKMTPEIREMRNNIHESEKAGEKLKSLAWQQMKPLNGLFTPGDALRIIESTVPFISFDPVYSAEKEADMKINYDFEESEDGDDVMRSAVDTLSGSYNGNPFLYENILESRMGTETYTGSETISWEESYTDSEGKRQTETHTETLYASVEKPMPYFEVQSVLSYGSQAAPNLYFSRRASHIDRKDEDAVERAVKRGKKKISRMTEKAISSGNSFMNMSNTDFEVLFKALNRTDEVGFRTLFTPLAQKNMTKLILSDSPGYGDDFSFFKNRRMNRISTDHSREKPLYLYSGNYVSYSFDDVRENFINANAEYFRSMYFDFAPLLAIPAYQERPVHSLKPIPALSRRYSLREAEVLANMIDRNRTAHPDTKTEAVLTADFIKSEGNSDIIRVRSLSYDTESHVDYVSVHGGDGRFHDVPVPWDEYIPLEYENDFRMSEYSPDMKDSTVLAYKNGLCMTELR